jgi:hypothetical protein
MFAHSSRRSHIQILNIEHEKLRYQEVYVPVGSSYRSVIGFLSALLLAPEQESGMLYVQGP